MAWIYEIGVAKYFTESQRQNNAVEFYHNMNNRGYTLESICGMLGNIERESTLNPGIKQYDSTQAGWGLIQWSPSTDLTVWTDAWGVDWWDGSAQCDLIVEEGEHPELHPDMWKPTSTYPYSWAEFTSLTDPYLACRAYLYERERAGAEYLQERLDNTKKWMEYLGGGEIPDPDPDPDPPKPWIPSKKMPFWMYLRPF